MIPVTVKWLSDHTMNSVQGFSTEVLRLPCSVTVLRAPFITYLANAMATSDRRASSMDPLMEDSFHTLCGLIPVTLFSEWIRCSTVALARYLSKASAGVN
ncbi:MAG: hypothetical protein IKS22_05240 [Bacteroidales bacterium]|nr:hypothetical protein [Bacteroidales bacterium]